MPPIDAVIFDLGGVVMGSPLAAIARYERDHGLPPQAISQAIRTAGGAGAWPRLERGELSLEAFLAPFEAVHRGSRPATAGHDRSHPPPPGARPPRRRAHEQLGLGGTARPASRTGAEPALRELSALVGVALLD